MYIVYMYVIMYTCTCTQYHITNTHTLSLSSSPLSLHLPLSPFPSPSLPLSPFLPPYQTVSKALPFHTDRWIGRKQFLQVSNMKHSLTTSLSIYYRDCISGPHIPSEYPSVCLVSCSLVSTRSLYLKMVEKIIWLIGIVCSHISPPLFPHAPPSLSTLNTETLKSWESRAMETRLRLPTDS